MFSTFTHSLHGASRARSAADVAAAPPAAAGGATIACCGRLVCVAQASHVDVYDAHDAHDTSDMFGAGSCKLRFVCAFPVVDISDAVAVGALLFLRGGLLALAGQCTRGTGLYLRHQWQASLAPPQQSRSLLLSHTLHAQSSTPTS